MIRTQIQLTEAQAEVLKRLARERRVSMAALIREAVDELVSRGSERDVRWERAMSVVGKYRDREGATDVAENHDRYFAEAVRDWRSS